MDKALHLLSLARRAGRIALGYDAVEEAVLKRKALLVLLSEALSERTRRNIVRICEGTVPLRMIPTEPETIAKFVGKAVGVIAVGDPNLAAAIDKALPPTQTDTV